MDLQAISQEAKRNYGRAVKDFKQVRRETWHNEIMILKQQFKFVSKIVRKKKVVYLVKKNQLTMKNTLMRIFVVVTLSIIIWNLISYLSDISSGGEYSRINHFFIAVITTILSVILIDFARRIDKISWKQLNLSPIRTNILSFLVGLILWAIPALIGLVICLMVGWVEITVKTDFNHLVLSLLILFITVFLIEALPEEIIFRGYIYRYLNIWFPHWMTLILQTLLFSLFGYFIGAIYSLEQLLFIPGFAFILGYFRAVSGNVWTAIGFHVAIMTATQILSRLHDHFDVSGIFTLQFLAFILLPSVLSAIALDFIYPKHNWHKKELYL
ncbi:CPBP family intramembrane metalloprotease [Virgibacillus dakarensis]|uniref:CPBP family intramembrane glutamic endopeptidase n=1 Tax=Lentibacillus populi TaxID=1827502 RepID=UPI000C8314CE|nr:type II CAAX endopeptidase family protein [Lentibacillus populi]MBT2214339.1 CPBP family intramembrane metalloprotease [Virgibacillus dakarensis]